MNRRDERRWRSRMRRAGIDSVRSVSTISIGEMEKRIASGELEKVADGIYIAHRARPERAIRRASIGKTGSD